ncbi:LacI family DNA-binding transcriptional regulator [Paenibacillus amylolyticus]|nr:LacI family DNA-binding transcriptional regulator [Paenibacillus amylolyticus]
MITIKDIAKLAGVSYSTVSKALNDDPRIKPATKQKVLAVAEKHQYRKTCWPGNSPPAGATLSVLCWMS